MQLTDTQLAEFKTITILSMNDKVLMEDIINTCSFSGNSQKSPTSYAWQLGVGVSTINRSLHALSAVGLIVREMLPTRYGRSLTVSPCFDVLAKYIIDNRVAPPALKPTKATKAKKAITVISSRIEAIGYDACLLALSDRYSKEAISIALSAYDAAYSWGRGFRWDNANINENPTETNIEALIQHGFSDSELTAHIEANYIEHGVSSMALPATFTFLLNPAHEEQFEIDDFLNNDIDPLVLAHNNEVRKANGLKPDLIIEHKPIDFDNMVFTLPVIEKPIEEKTDFMGDGLEEYAAEQGVNYDEGDVDTDSLPDDDFNQNDDDDDYDFTSAFNKNPL